MNPNRRYLSLFLTGLFLVTLLITASCVYVRRIDRDGTPAPAPTPTSPGEPGREQDDDPGIPGVSASPARPEAERPTGPFGTPDDMEMRVFRLVNEQRTENGLSALEYDSTAFQAAKFHSIDMAQRGFFAHDSPEGESVTDRLRRFDFEFAGASWGENLAVNRNVPDPAPTTVEGWMRSPGHRRNILNERFTHGAVGISRYENTIYYTQVFWGR